jgi:lipopolysaccharide/colanic/teichoic acid biosynthesis glycosyltransferase
VVVLWKLGVVLRLRGLVSAGWLPAVALGLAVATVAVAWDGWQFWHALLLGFGAMAAGAVVESVSASRSAWARRRGLSPAAIAVVVIALGVGWNVDGWGLAPLHAVLAVLLAVVFTALTSLVPASPSVRRLLVVGDGEVTDMLCAAVAREEGVEVVGRLDDRPGANVVGSLDQLEGVAADERVDVVVFAYSSSSDRRLAELALRCRDLDLEVAVVPRLVEQFGRRVSACRVGGVPLLLVDPRAHETHAPLVSRAFDIALASVLLVLTAPLWLVLSLAIVLDERGPVLYRARRVGYGGREFDMFKFRKMPRDAAGPPLTVADDARFSRIGRMLARTKLDELPQLVNVLRGEMAFVGPRPEDPSYVAAYPAEFAAITRVRPGITGLSQIQYRDEAALLVGDDFETLYRDEVLPQKIDLDRYYACHRCLALDLRILAWTAVAIVAGAHVHRDELTRSVSFRRVGGQPQPEALPDVWPKAS